MFINFEDKKIIWNITNENYLNYQDDFRRISISNNDCYAYPNRKHYYNVELNNISSEFYIDSGHSVIGVFDNIKFKKGTFFDNCNFNNVIFKDCDFEDVDIRWCKFNNCKFINCNGRIKYIRGTTFKKNCVFENTCMHIHFIDEYMYFDSKRQHSGYSDVCLK